MLPKQTHKRKKAEWGQRGRGDSKCSATNTSDYFLSQSFSQPPFKLSLKKRDHNKSKGFVAPEHLLQTGNIKSQHCFGNSLHK